jgi:hypothetical protein
MPSSPTLPSLSPQTRRLWGRTSSHLRPYLPLIRDLWLTGHGTAAIAVQLYRAGARLVRSPIKRYTESQLLQAIEDSVQSLLRYELAIQRQRTQDATNPPPTTDDLEHLADRDAGSR